MKNNIIITNIRDCSKYSSRHPLFNKIFEFIKNTDFDKLPEGRTDIEGDKLFVNHIRTNGKDNGAMEMHRDYIDLHFLISGEETIGIKRTENVISYSKIYDKESDCALTEEGPDEYIRLIPGQMAIIYPDYAHLPALSSGPIHKIIAKILV